MTKKHFIELADQIRIHNRNSGVTPFNSEHLETLASFCAVSNSRFMKERWIGYVLGHNGKNGGQVK